MSELWPPQFNQPNSNYFLTQWNLIHQNFHVYRMLLVSRPENRARNSATPYRQRNVAILRTEHHNITLSIERKDFELGIRLSKRCGNVNKLVIFTSNLLFTKPTRVQNLQQIPTRNQILFGTQFKTSKTTTQKKNQKNLNLSCQNTSKVVDKITNTPSINSVQ